MLPSIPRTHVVITFAKTRHFITPAENTKLLTLGNGVMVKLGESVINTSSIAEILSMEDFYAAHPDERPSDLQEVEIMDVPHVPLERQAESSRHRLHGLLSGMQAYAEANPGGNAPNLLAERIRKYESLYGKYDAIITEHEAFELDKLVA